MNLKDKINEDLKTAMKEKDAVKLQTIRSIRALILEFEKSGTDKELTPEDEIKMLSQAAKKRQESIEQFRNAGRNELADKEEAELKIIQVYLPKQLTIEEIEAEVKRIAADVGAVSKADFAKVMPVAAKEMKGKADGKTIKTIVEKVLGNN
ncbi:MAG: GatB/YqeY domain-containing protein [Bacteroidetes bacterium]|nr:GatB/YqeY domain-containing protein [Bacteroidota bacterium]